MVPYRGHLHHSHMNYFVVQVKTREEEKYRLLARQALHGSAMRLVYPQRRLRQLRRGNWKDVLKPLYPGYIFLEGEEITVEDYWKLRHVPGFLRFLETNTNIRPIEGADRELLLHFLRFGEVVEKSKVTFGTDSRIRVLEGPLAGLEGRIIKINKRKGRAKVRLDLYNSSFPVDLGFEIIEKAVSQ